SATRRSASATSTAGRSGFTARPNALTRASAVAVVSTASLCAPRGAPLLQPGPERFLGLGREVGVGVEDAGAGVPAQQGVVVAGRTDGGGRLVVLHRLAEPVVDGVAGA